MINKELLQICSEIIDYLNNKVCKNFKPTTRTTQSMISKRIKENYTVDDFKK